MKLIDLTGVRFGRLTVVRRELASVRRDAWGNVSQTIWLCRCDCGNFTRVERSNLLRGKTRSCGCLKHDFKSWNHGKTPVGQPEQD